MIRFTEGVINRRQKRTAHKVNYRKLLAICFDYRPSKSWCSWRKVRRSHHSRLVIDKIKNFFIIPRVVAHRQSMNA
ncbi:hypothetical protein D3C71_1706950 [compost metagenome]